MQRMLILAKKRQTISCPALAERKYFLALQKQQLLQNPIYLNLLYFSGFIYYICAKSKLPFSFFALPAASPRAAASLACSC